MTAGRPSPVIQLLRRAALGQDAGGRTDGELLGGFVARRDGAALEALIRRHGPMVLAVCRRVLGNESDAEDAFQAAFLVFVRKAATIRARELVGNWLYGVAYRTALKARSAAARRRAKERRAAIMTPTRVDDEEDWAELLPLLDRELNRLPDKYRIPLVLCELEGRSRKEAAGKLGVPEGTLSSRLATGRRMLARRLAPHRTGSAGCGLAAALARASAGTGVPPPLLASTAKAASLFTAGQAATAVVSARVAALAEGVLKTMLLTKLTVCFLAAFAVAASAAVVFACRPPAPAAQAPPTALAPAPAVLKDKSEVKEVKSEWGEAVDGVQARLRAPRADWDAGEAPTFILDLRNRGKETPNARRVGVDCQIEVDGTWYSFMIPSGPYTPVGDLLEPGKQIDDWATVSPGKNWRSFKGKAVDFSLAPGKHTVRIAYRLQGVIPGIRPVSGPLEIEVGKESAWGDADGGVQDRVRTPKAVWREGEAPTFTLDLRTVGKVAVNAPHVNADLEIEADGAWYRDSSEADRRAKAFLASDRLLEQATDWLTVTADKRWVLKAPSAGKAEHFPLPPGKHTIRVSYEVSAGGKTFRPVSGPIEIEVRAEDEAWGEAVDGVQARLRPSKVAWDRGENPEFTLDLRNRGKNTHALCRSPAYCRIEVDGKPYIQAAAAVIKYETTPLKPGDEVSGWLMFQPTFWFPRMPGGGVGTPNDEEECLTTSAGKHTMRAYLGFDVGDPPGVVPSQPVEFEIGKQSDWGKDDGGIQARVRTPKAVWAPKETPKFLVDLQNVGDKATHSLHIPFDCEIEVDGTWYYYNGPVDVTSQDTKLEPGKHYKEWVRVTPDYLWQERAPKDRKPRMLLPLSPGKHTIRIAYPINSEKPPLRPVTGPIEIEVRKDSAGEQGADGKEEPQPLLKPTQGPGRVPFLPPDAPPPPRPSDPPSVP